MVSSTDGYCTLVTFEEGELGIPYKDQVVRVKTKEEVEEDIRAKNSDKEGRKLKKKKERKMEGEQV